jgi:hypothetical protein
MYVGHFNQVALVQLKGGELAHWQLQGELLVTGKGSGSDFQVLSLERLALFGPRGDPLEVKDDPVGILSCGLPRQTTADHGHDHRPSPAFALPHAFAKDH